MGDVKLVSPYDMVPTLDAIRLVVKHAPSAKKIAVPVDECVGYICAEDVYAARNIPEVSTAVMDGFAFHSSVFEGVDASCPVTLRVLDNVFAGNSNKAAQSVADSALSSDTPALSTSLSLAAYRALCASLSFSQEELGVAVYVSTGAPLPPWCDCVQQVEECTEVAHLAPSLDASGAKGVTLSTTQLPTTPSRFTLVAVAKAVSGQFVRPPGIDVPRGAVVLGRGDAITAGDKAVLISVGVRTVSVYAFPRVCVVSTGNEVMPYQRVRGDDAHATDAGVNSERERESKIPPGMVVDSNGPMLLEMISALAPPAAGKHTFSEGNIPETVPLIQNDSTPTASTSALRQGPASLFPYIVRDDPLALCCALLEASLAHGVVVLTGGVSMGDKDHCKYVLQRCGQVLFGRMHMKPGKPATAALFHCREAAAFLRAHGQDTDIDAHTYPRTCRYLRALRTAKGGTDTAVEHPSSDGSASTYFEGLDTEALVIALPGNPVSAFVCAHLLCRPVLLKASGACVRFTREKPEKQSQSSEDTGFSDEAPWPALLPPRVPAVLLHSVRTDPERPEFHRMRVRYDAAAQVFVCYSTGNQASSRLLNVAQCDGLAYLDHAAVDLNKQPLQCHGCRVGGRASGAADELAVWRREVYAELPHASAASAAPQCCPVSAFAGLGWLPRGAVVDVLLTRDLHRQPDAFAALSAMELRLVEALEQQARSAGVAKTRETACATLNEGSLSSSHTIVTGTAAASGTAATTHTSASGPVIASKLLLNSAPSTSASAYASASPDSCGDTALARLMSRYQFGGKHECRCGSKSDRVAPAAATGTLQEKAKEAVVGAGQVLAVSTQPLSFVTSVSGTEVGVMSASVNPHQLPHTLNESPDVAVAAIQASAPTNSPAGVPITGVNVDVSTRSVVVDSGIRVGVVTVSTSCADGLNEDKSGPRIADILAAYNAQTAAKQSSSSQRPPRFDVVHTAVVCDDVVAIEALLRRLAGQASASDGGPDGYDSERVDVVFTSGGTGFSPSDVTPECTRRVIDKEAPGISQFMMQTSLSCTPMGALSRAVAGIAGRTLIINLPGSPKAIVEVLPTLLPILPHAVRLIKGT